MRAVEQAGSILGGGGDVVVHAQVHDHRELVFHALALHRGQSDLDRLFVALAVIDQVVGGLGAQGGDDVQVGADDRVHQGVGGASLRART